MKYYILAGEASGDLHGSNLIKALQRKDVNCDVRCWGGDLMQATGAHLVKHYKDRAFMGFIEILMNLKKIFTLILFCKKDIIKYKPDVIIFIDNSGFNLPIAKWAKTKGYKTNYYISPQIWASRASRVKAIKRDIDKMFVILPFVKPFYNTYNVDVEFVGHPLIDAIADTTQVNPKTFRQLHKLGSKPIIALLPGSRKQEITKMLATMLSIIKDFPKYQFVIGGAPNQDFNFYNKFITHKNVSFISNKTYELLSVSYAALVTSGTATLETALFKVPQVVCYKGSAISYYIAKRIITLKYISLVNLVMDKEVVTELIQNNFNKNRLKSELNKILNTETRETMFANYYELEQKLGGRGASEKTATIIYKSLNA